jgi:hypothetical protein
MPILSLTADASPSKGDFGVDPAILTPNQNLSGGFVGRDGVFVQKLHALDITNGKEKPGRERCDF